MKGALSHIHVLDLSRHLAGPWCAQMLGDMGATVIKVERPGAGDDVRSFGPPFIKDKDGNDTRQSPFFYAANRNKKSVTIDLASPEGQELVRTLAAKSDVLIENYRAGTLTRYGLGYEDIKKVRPDIVYCSVTGFGQTGPYRDRAGYDSVFQAMSGMMSITGLPDGEPGGGPLKTGSAISDMTAGMYSSIAVLGALNYRAVSGEGQYIDMALLDAQVAGLSVENTRHLLLDEVPGRLGHISRNMVPTQTFKCKDAYLVLAVGNDGQFSKFIAIMGHPELAKDERYAKNAARIKNRLALTTVLDEIFLTRTVAEWIATLAPAGVPCGAVNNIKQVFEDPHVQSRGMRVEIEHPTLGKFPAVANPIKFSATPIQYRSAPPMLGEHTAEVLKEYANVDGARLEELRRKGVI